MKNSDVLILAGAALAAWWIVNRGGGQKSTGGWYRGEYVNNLLDRQYAEGWGYGD